MMAHTKRTDQAELRRLYLQHAILLAAM